MSSRLALSTCQFQDSQDDIMSPCLEENELTKNQFETIHSKY